MNGITCWIEPGSLVFVLLDHAGAFGHPGRWIVELGWFGTGDAGTARAVVVACVVDDFGALVPVGGSR